MKTNSCMIQSMRLRKTFCSAAAAVLLIGCGSSSDETVPLSDDGTSDAPTLDDIKTMEYAIVDPAVRSVLSKAGLGFSVPVRDGVYLFPASALTGDYSRVEVDTGAVVFGDVTGDGTADAVVPLRIGEGETARTDLAAVSLTASGSAKHVASFPLGVVQIRSLAITNGSIRVNFMHTVSGDPGPRNTELLLTLPESVLP